MKHLSSALVIQEKNTKITYMKHLSSALVIQEKNTKK